MSKGKKSKAPASDAVSFEGLIKDPLCDEKWQPFIILAIPENSSSLLPLQSLLSAIDNKCRRKFISFTKEGVLASAREDAKLLSATGPGGGGRKSKQSVAVSKPLYVEVCQHVVNAQASNDLTHALMAKLLKYILLKKRNDDLTYVEIPQKEVEDKPIKGASAKAKGSDRTSKKGKVTPAADIEKFPMPQKLPTTMKKRGEESESQYIDDEPQPGPSCYIVLTGFNETDLLPHLCEVGILVDILYKITNLPVHVSEAKQEDEQNEEVELLQNTLVKFWNNIDTVISSSPSGSVLRNMAILDHKSTFDVENTDFGMDMFTEVATKVYEILKYQKQYRHYLKYLDVKNILLTVTHQKDSDVSCLCHDNMSPTDMRYYNEKLDELPQESIDPALILKYMIDQVDLLLTPKSHHEMDKSHPQLSSAFNKVCNTLQVEYTEHDQDTSEIPVIHDYDQNELAHIQTPSFFSEHHPWLLHLFTPPELPASSTLLYQKQLHELKQFTDTIPQLEVNSILSMLLTILSLEYIQPPTINEEPPINLDVSFSNLLFDYPLNIPYNTSTLSISPESLNFCKETTLSLPEKKVDLSEYKIFEPLNQKVILQVIQKYLSTHPYIRLYQQKLTGNMIVAMYSGFDNKPGQYQWQRHVHSKIGFSNFLSYISELVGSAVDAAAEDEALLLKELEQQQAEAILNAKQEVNTPLPPQPDSKSSSAKSSKKSASSSANKKGSKATTSATTDKDSTEADNLNIVLPVKKLYTGYNVGDKVLLANGTVNTAFTYDGIRITVEHIHFTHEPNSMSVSVLHENIFLSASFTTNGTFANEESGKAGEIPVENSHTNNNPLPHVPNCFSFSAFKASLNENLTLAVSCYGSNGNGELSIHPKSEIELRKLEQSRPESSQSSRPSSHDKKVSKKQQEEQQRLLEQQQALDMKNKEILLQKVLTERESIQSAQKHQKLSLTTSEGLQIMCSSMANAPTENDETASTVVLQQFTSPPKCFSKEICRIYLDDGSVLKKMTNGITFILCHDGKVFETYSSTLKNQAVQDISNTNKVSFSDTNTCTCNDMSDDEEMWQVTFPDGKRQIWKFVVTDKNDEQSSSNKSFITLDRENINPVRTYLSTDPKSKEVMLTREDNVIILKKPDGNVIVNHADGTKIMSSMSSSCYTFKHPLFVTTTYDKLKCALQLPTVTVTTDSPGQYTVNSNTNDYNLAISANGEISYTFDQSVYSINHSCKSDILSATDCVGVKYNVTPSGLIQVRDNLSEMTVPESLHPHFFVIEEDGNGYEIHRSSDVTKLINKAKGSDVVQIIEDDSVEANCTILVSALKSTKTPVYEVNQIIPEIFVASLDSEMFSNKTSLGAKINRSLIEEKNQLSKYPNYKNPIAFKYREFFQPKEEPYPLSVAFRMCLVKYLEWKNQSEKAAKEILPLKIGSSLQSSSKDVLLSSESLMTYYKSLWKKRNESYLPTTAQEKPTRVPNVNNNTDTKALQYSITNKHFLPYFESKIGIDFLQSFHKNAPSVSKSVISASDTTYDLPVDSKKSPTGEKTTSSIDVIHPAICNKVKSQQKSPQCTEFQVTPQELDFGNLREGCIYTAKCSLRNVGIGTSQFTINTPPSASGIRVIYTPGYVVAGTSRSFIIELFAIANETMSSNYKRMIYHELEISTDMGMIYLPIQACIYSFTLFTQCYTHAMEGSTPIVTSYHMCQ